MKTTCSWQCLLHRCEGDRLAHSLIQLSVLQRIPRYQINLSRLRFPAMWRRAHRLHAATNRSRPPSQNSPPSEPQATCRTGFRFLWLYRFPDFSRSVYLGSSRPIRKNKVPQNYKNFEDNIVNRRSTNTLPKEMTDNRLIKRDSYGEWINVLSLIAIITASGPSSKRP
jgi:hypothetical protein